MRWPGVKVADANGVDDPVERTGLLLLPQSCSNPSSTNGVADGSKARTTARPPRRYDDVCLARSRRRVGGGG